MRRTRVRQRLALEPTPAAQEREPTRPLPQPQRDRLERGFGRDLGRVRLQTGASADSLTRSQRALAVTLGDHIALSPRAPSLDSLAGQALLAHEVAHTLQQRGDRGTADARQDEHEADQAAAAAGLHWLRPRETASPTVAEGGGLRMRACSEDAHVRSSYQEAIEDLDQVGLPTRFLGQVAVDYEFFEGSGDYVRPGLDNMTLSEDTLEELDGIEDLDRLSFASTAIQTLYHESTHAYADLMSDDRAWERFIEAGEAHYEDAPMQGGETSDDPARVFQEAIASYVGGRAASYHSALNSLRTYQAMLARGQIEADRVDFLRGVIARVRRDYDRAAGDRVYGYEDDWGDQLSTTRPMSEDMADFLEEHVLDNAIPRSFDEAPVLALLEAEILAELDALEASAAQQAPVPSPPPADPRFGPVPLP